ncbi:hypothetical protein ACQZV8_03720 [Magnetococcales bacterium HHB-1]
MPLCSRCNRSTVDHQDDLCDDCKQAMAVLGLAPPSQKSKKTIPCPHCHGTKVKFMGDDNCCWQGCCNHPCPHCNGTGVVSEL